MAITADPIQQARSSTRAARKRREAATPPLRILAAVDGSERTGRVIKHLIVLQTRGMRLEVVLLNVQPEPEDWRLRGYGWFKREAIRERLVGDLAQPIVASAGRQLDGAGIAHKDRIELGNLAETTIRCAREEDCDLIVLAEAPPGRVRRWLVRTAGVAVGSTASAVIALAHVPVVVAK
jgi:nucleotide-binding universal stress UspA family protein